MLKKIILPALLVMGLNANADETKGLIGVEVGYMGTEVYTPTGGTDGTDSVSLGLKLGAESRHYRAFLETRWWNDSAYDNAYTLGVALQYIIRTNVEWFNIFLGLNGGGIHTVGESSEMDAYYGGDAGVNFDISKYFGIEVGGRYSLVDGNDKVGYLDKFYQGYVSAIFKFDTDY